MFVPIQFKPLEFCKNLGGCLCAYDKHYDGDNNHQHDKTLNLHARHILSEVMQPPAVPDIAEIITISPYVVKQINFGVIDSKNFKNYNFNIKF